MALRGRLVLEAAEVEYAVNDDTMKFALVLFAQLLSIGAYGVKGQEEVAREDVVHRIVETDMVGVVVVMEKLTVHLQDALVAAEDVVDLPHPLTVAGSHALYPLPHGSGIDGGKGDLVGVKLYHRFFLF